MRIRPRAQFVKAIRRIVGFLATALYIILWASPLFATYYLMTITPCLVRNTLGGCYVLYGGYPFYVYLPLFPYLILVIIAITVEGFATTLGKISGQIFDWGFEL